MWLRRDAHYLLGTEKEMKPHLSELSLRYPIGRSEYTGASVIGPWSAFEERRMGQPTRRCTQVSTSGMPLKGSLMPAVEGTVTWIHCPAGIGYESITVRERICREEAKGRRRLVNRTEGQ